MGLLNQLVPGGSTFDLSLKRIATSNIPFSSCKKKKESVKQGISLSTFIEAAVHTSPATLPVVERGLRCAVTRLQLAGGKGSSRGEGGSGGEGSTTASGAAVRRRAPNAQAPPRSDFSKKSVLVRGHLSAGATLRRSAWRISALRGSCPETPALSSRGSVRCAFGIPRRGFPPPFSSVVLFPVGRTGPSRAARARSPTMASFFKKKTVDGESLRGSALAFPRVLLNLT